MHDVVTISNLVLNLLVDWFFTFLAFKKVIRSYIRSCEQPTRNAESPPVSRLVIGVDWHLKDVSLVNVAQYEHSV